MESKYYIRLTEMVFVSIDSIGFINKLKKTLIFIKMGDFLQQMNYSVLDLLHYLLAQNMQVRYVTTMLHRTQFIISFYISYLFGANIYLCTFGLHVC